MCFQPCYELYICITSLSLLCHFSHVSVTSLSLLCHISITSLFLSLVLLMSWCSCEVCSSLTVGALVLDDDEFDTEMSPPSSPLGQCRAIYDYAAQQYDELTIKCGKWTQGWTVGWTVGWIVGWIIWWIIGWTQGWTIRWKVGWTVYVDNTE